MQIFRRIFSDLYRQGHRMRMEELLLFLQKIKVFTCQRIQTKWDYFTNQLQRKYFCFQSIP